MSPFRFPLISRIRHFAGRLWTTLWDKIDAHGCHRLRALGELLSQAFRPLRLEIRFDRSDFDPRPRRMARTSRWLH